jgi:hypothetical protein
MADHLNTAATGLFPHGKELRDWSHSELLTYNQAQILLAIPTGEFNIAVWRAMDLTLRWRAERG